MNWTENLPTVHGYYWLYGLTIVPEIVQVWSFQRQFYVVRDNGDMESLSKPWYQQGVLWYGPLIAPKGWGAKSEETNRSD